MTTNGILLRKFAADLKKAGLQRVNISLDSVNTLVYKKLTGGGKLEEVMNGIYSAIENNLQPVKINCVVEKTSDEENAREVKEFCIKNKLEARFITKMDLSNGLFSEVEGGMGGRCNKCNRLRLSANGMIRPCLFDEQEYSVREMGAEKAMRLALMCKPLKGSRNTKTNFYNIGG